ncbi:MULTISPECIES: sugar ABC transporter permease [unclassified Bradyrhizobium]|uniref:carbohydrate ABC transporter permease n=1 Tax=unclassified Bradyrhizobium TaxID=2631580 RepID=UPI001FF7244D|nr:MULTISPECIES: sugar ABC transporter permease [unclassified Bradyrhizobium]
MLFLIAPAAIVLACFEIIPILIGMNASFRDWSLVNPQRTWVGLKQYVAVFTDPVFLKIVLPNTFLLMTASVGLSLAFGLALASLLNRPFFGRAVVRTIILLPLTIAPVITATMIRWSFNDQFGVITNFLSYLGLADIGWLSDRWPSFALVIMTDIWIWTPWFTIILLAALQGLPPEPFEAARIDAATPWCIFRRITMPMLRPVIIVCVLIRAIDAFRTFDQVWILTGGGPARSTEVFSVYTYVLAFVDLDIGRGAAAAGVGAIIMLFVGGVLYKLVNRSVEVSR